MKLRTKRRLLDSLSLVIFAIGAGILVTVLRQPTGSAIEAPATGAAFPAATGTAPRSVVTLDPARWNRTLRQPLYDPPPPPKKEVVVEVRPISVKLVGTMIEPDNAQAFVRQASGTVELKRVGDPVTGQEADGVISQIVADEIVIKRSDGEHHISVERQN